MKRCFSPAILGQNISPASQKDLDCCIVTMNHGVMKRSAASVLIVTEVIRRLINIRKPSVQIAFDEAAVGQGTSYVEVRDPLVVNGIGLENTWTFQQQLDIIRVSSKRLLDVIAGKRNEDSFIVRKVYRRRVFGIQLVDIGAAIQKLFKANLVNSDVI